MLAGWEFSANQRLFCELAGNLGGTLNGVDLMREIHCGYDDPGTYPAGDIAETHRSHQYSELRALWPFPVAATCACTVYIISGDTLDANFALRPAYPYLLRPRLFSRDPRIPTTVAIQSSLASLSLINYH